MFTYQHFKQFTSKKKKKKQIDKTLRKRNDSQDNFRIYTKEDK